MEIEIINKVLNHWKEECIFSEDKLSLMNISLTKNQIIMPVDFIELYKVSNGTSDSDCEGFRFYKYEELKTMGDKFSYASNNPLHKVVIFADYMQQSWWYGVRINNSGYEVGIIPEANKFKVITNSLFEFLDFYLADDSNLYNSNN